MSSIYGKANPYIQSLAGTVMILGFAELIIGACARNVVTNYGFGAWWTGFCCFLAGMNGVLRGNRNLRGSGYCLR